MISYCKSSVVQTNLLSHRPEPAGPVLRLIHHRGQLRRRPVFESERRRDDLLQVENTNVPQRAVQRSRTLPVVEGGQLLTGFKERSKPTEV